MSGRRQEFKLSQRGAKGRAAEWGYFQPLSFQRLVGGVGGGGGGDYLCWLELSLLCFQ